MNQLLDPLLANEQISPIETLQLDARPPFWAAVPPPYDTHLGNWFARGGGAKDRLWLHQAASLAAIAAGDDLVLATGTASGKSLVFQAAVVASLFKADTRHLILYPQKALAADQTVRWKAALGNAGLPDDCVAELNGDVAPHERGDILKRARVVLATPDVIHAWLMRSLSLPAVKTFLAKLDFIVIDEAHALEGQFGSSTAFLLRRLLHVHDALTRSPVHFIAASATIGLLPVWWTPR